MMTNGDLKGRIFLTYPHTNNGFFLARTLFIYLIIYLFIKKHKLLEVPENAIKMQYHMATLLDVLGKIACD